MHHSAYVNAEKFYKKYCENNIENKTILDVGSYDVNGTMKPIFQKGIYLGVDMEEGPNVDVVANANELPFKDESFDIVISSSCFEHDDMFWETFLEMCRVAKPDGYLYVQAPQNGPYHGWPGDNWRFYADSWRALAKWGNKNGYGIELVESYIDETTPPHETEGTRFWNDSVGIFKKVKTDKVVSNIKIKDIEKGHHEFTYRGIKSLKCPFDYATYQMIINEVKPDLIIEIGTHYGGNTLYMADLLDIIGNGIIHTIDIKDFKFNELLHNHPRIKRFYDGYAGYDLSNAKGFEKILIIDDGSHEYKDVINAFNKFKDLVSVESYYIIEDGVLAELGHDNEKYDGGPLRAINEIIKTTSEYIIDEKWSNFFGKNATFNPNGFLKKVKKQTNNIVLITSFCNSDDKVNLLHKNIQLLKDNGLDVAVMSPIPLPEKIHNLSDYTFITKENPILDWPTKSMSYWRTYVFGDKKVMTWTTCPDYGWAGLNQTKRLAEIFSNYEYDYYGFIIYDTIITDDVLKVLKRGYDKIVFPSKRKDTKWDVGLHLMSFNKENLKMVAEKITFENYLSNPQSDAFLFLHNLIVRPMDIKIGDFYVEDEIYHYEKEEKDLLNHSPEEDISFFIVSEHESNETIKVLFTKVEDNLDITFTINNVEYNQEVQVGSFVDTNQRKNDIMYFTLRYKNKIIDMMEIIKKIKHSSYKIERV